MKPALLRSTFPSNRQGRSETTIFTYDALIYQDYELEVKAKGTPLKPETCHQFFQRVKVLEERLSTDRSVVRSLVVAVQHWEELRKVLNTELQHLGFLGNVFSDPRWPEDRENQFETLALASAYLQKLKAVDFRIQTELIQEIDGLIQRVTNLISIDEGYRYRDQNDMDHGE
ncbi:hypothetical protein EsDP_00002917 [Epichloe bromicola]|uniref:Uncharacterized protein n=1 Tax=Epichloe bromicola TaxID=79588 RepID=A0ABQ0CM73_9HYPO